MPTGSAAGTGGLNESMLRGPPMNEITVGNPRCCRERPIARIAPLTLPVGANSTGATSMMVLVRTLWVPSLSDRAGPTGGTNPRRWFVSGIGSPVAAP